jgi:hypothetical protein
MEVNDSVLGHMLSDMAIFTISDNEMACGEDSHHLYATNNHYAAWPFTLLSLSAHFVLFESTYYTSLCAVVFS